MANISLLDRGSLFPTSPPNRRQVQNFISSKTSQTISQNLNRQQNDQSAVDHFWPATSVDSMANNARPPIVPPSGKNLGRRFSEQPTSGFGHNSIGISPLAYPTAIVETSANLAEQQRYCSTSSEMTLSRSLSSPELLQLPFLLQPGDMSPSPQPTMNELAPLIVLSPTPSPLAGSGTAVMEISTSSSLQSFGHSPSTTTTTIFANNKLQKNPKVQLNGSSILSIVGAESTHLLMSSNSTTAPSSTTNQSQNSNNNESARRDSVGSAQSGESRRNLISLQTVGRTIQRTHNQLKRTRLWHVFYLVALPVYTLIGALIFQALDGARSDHLMELYRQRCREDRDEKMQALEKYCAQIATSACFDRMREFVNEVDLCYRRWHDENKTMTHPMSDFTNAVIYAFSVYTTIGYGTISASSMPARIATVFYGAFGIPLFFAFIKEEGNQCRTWFVWMYGAFKSHMKRWHRSRCSIRIRKQKSSPSSYVQSPVNNKAESSALVPAWDQQQERRPISALSGRSTAIPMDPEPDGPSPPPPTTPLPSMLPLQKRQRLRPIFARNPSQQSMLHGGYTNECNGRAAGARFSGGGKPGGEQSSRSMVMHVNAVEQRRVFLCGVLVFIIYLLAVSALFTQMTEWDFFTAFYFLFNSVALIGFGDVFPSQSRIILVNMFFIVTGVVLFSMCYFILQEEIRVTAFEASRKARMSICKFNQSLMLHTKTTWSRRNSPAFDGNEPSTNFEKLRKRRQSAPSIIALSRSESARKASVPGC